MQFFFSRRRRHTRWPRDWSSDVCSSDLFAGRVTLVLARKYAMTSMASKKTILVGGCVGLGILLCLVPFVHNLALALAVLSLALALVAAVRSEERRVGKEWGSGWWQEE